MKDLRWVDDRLLYRHLIEPVKAKKHKM